MSEPTLTKRRQQVIELLAEGYTNSAIGRKLSISPLSVDNMVKRCAKLFLPPFDRSERHPRHMLALWWIEKRSLQRRKHAHLS